MPGAFLPDIHIDQALSTLALAYEQEGQIWDTVAPPVPVDQRSARYWIYGREAFRRRDDLRRPGAEAITIRQTVSLASFNAEEHAEKTPVTAAEERYAATGAGGGMLNPRVDASDFVMESITNNREFRVVSIITDPTQVTQNVTLSGTSQWSDYTNSTPLTDIRTAKNAVRQGVLRRATDLTISYEGALTLADHPSIKVLKQFTDENALEESGLPATLRGLRVNEAGSFIDTSVDGQTPALSSAFGKNALVHYTNPTPGRKVISFAYSFEAPDDLSGVRGPYVRSWWDDKIKGTWYEGAVTYDVQVVAPLGGYLLLAVTT